MKAPRYSGMQNPLKGKQPQGIHGVGAQRPIGVAHKNPIGKFEIGKRSHNSKVKEVFGNPR